MQRPLSAACRVAVCWIRRPRRASHVRLCCSRIRLTCAPGCRQAVCGLASQGIAERCRAASAHKSISRRTKTQAWLLQVIVGDLGLVAQACCMRSTVKCSVCFGKLLLTGCTAPRSRWPGYSTGTDFLLIAHAYLCKNCVLPARLAVRTGVVLRLSHCAVL